MKPASQNAAVTPEQLALMVDLLPTIGSLRDLCAVTGLRLDTVRRTVAPFLAIMKLQGTHPQCGCGKDRFHPYGCKDSAAKAVYPTEIPARNAEDAAAMLARRKIIIAEILTGASYNDIETRLSLSTKSARKYLRYMTPEQLAQRKKAEAERRETGKYMPVRRAYSPRKATPELKDDVRSLLDASTSIREIANILGITRYVAENIAAPIIEDMRASGTLPKCGCGKDRFHRYGCKDTFAKALRSMPVPGKKSIASAVILARREAVIAEIMTGASYREVEDRLGLAPKTARKFLRHMTPEQIKFRKDAEEVRRQIGYTPQQRRYNVHRSSIIEMLAAGKGQRDIERALGLTPGIVKNYTRLLTDEQWETRIASRIDAAEKRAEARKAEKEARRRQRKEMRKLGRRVRAGNVVDTIHEPVRPFSDQRYAKIAAAIPRYLSSATRDDAISEMYLALCEGSITEDDIVSQAKKYASKGFAMWESKYGNVSIDEMAFNDGDTRLIDLIPDESAIAAFDELDDVRVGRRRGGNPIFRMSDTISEGLYL